MARYGAGTQLTPQQVYALARAAGFSAGEAVYATAIALAESGGITNNWNDVAPDNSYGLWQVNIGVRNEMQADRGSPDQLVDPLYNAQQALRLARTPRSWNHWSVYLNGAYRQYLGAAQQAAAEVPDQMVQNVAGQAQQQAGGGTRMTTMDGGEDPGAPLGLPPLQGGGATGVGGLGLPAGASDLGSLPTDPAGFHMNPTTTQRFVTIGSDGKRYWSKVRPDGNIDLVPIAPNGQASTTTKPITIAKNAIAVMPDGRIISNTGAGGLSGNTVITPGQTVIGPGGNVVASSPSNPTVLGQGQVQVGPNGQVLAQNPYMSPEQIALKQQELNQQFQQQMAEAQRRWQQDRDSNAYNLAVTSLDGWYKNETLRNQRLVAAQNAAVQDRTLAQPQMFAPGTPYGTVVMPGALAGSAFGGQYGPAYSDTAAWGQPPNVMDTYKAAGGGPTNQWPTILQPQPPPVIQAQQPTGTQQAPVQQAASAAPAAALPNAPYSDAAARVENGLGGWRTWPADTTAPSGITPADAGAYAPSAAAPAASAPQEGQDYVYGSSPTPGAPPVSSSASPPATVWDRGGTAPPATVWDRGGTPPPATVWAGGNAPQPTPIDWGGINWPDMSGLGNAVGGALSGAWGQATSPVQPMEQKQWDDTLQTWRHPNGDIWDPNIGQWRPPSAQEGQTTFPEQPMGPSASSQVGNFLGGLGQMPNPMANAWGPAAGGGEWDFGSGAGEWQPRDIEQRTRALSGAEAVRRYGPFEPTPTGSSWDIADLYPMRAWNITPGAVGTGQGDPQNPQDLAAIGAGPDLGMPPVMPPGGSASPVSPDQVVGRGNTFGQPVQNETPFHKGEDYQASEGTPVQAPVAGTVVFVGDRGDLGTSVVIQDQAGQTHELNHLSTADVQVGDQVQVGQPVGQVGTTGETSGAHLDYRVRGQTGDFTNPQGLPGVGDVLGGMPNMDGMPQGMPQDQLGGGQGDSWYPYMTGPDDLVQSAGGYTNQLGGGGGEWDLLGSGQGEGGSTTYYADSGHVMRKTVWGGDESNAVYEDTGYTTNAPDGTGGNSAEDLWHYGQQQAAAPAAAQPAAPQAGTVNQPVTGTTQAPATTNQAAKGPARGPFTTQEANGWDFVYDADGNLVSYQPRYNPAQAETEGGWKMKLQQDAERAAAELNQQNVASQRDVAGIRGRADVLSTWGRAATGSPWIARLTGRSPAPGDLGSPEATGGFGWPPQQSQQSANLLSNITGPSQSPTSGGWQDAVPGATSSAYTRDELGWNDLVGKGGGEWGSGQGDEDARVAGGLGAGGLGPTAGSRISPWDDLIRQHAGEYANDPRFIRTVAAGARAESSDDPRAYQRGYDANNPQTWNKFGGRGLWQFDVNPGAMGYGASEQDLFNPAWQAERIVPEYANAYRRMQNGGLHDQALAAQVYGAAERPGGTQGGRWTSTSAPAYQNYARAYNELGSGQGDWSDYANVNQQFAGMESGWPTPPSAEEFTNLGPFGQSAMRYGMESAGVPWRPYTDAMLGAWRQTNQQAPTGLSGWAPRNVSRLGYDTASPTTRAQYSNEAELFMPVNSWMEKEQRRWQPEEARVSYAA